MSKLELSALNNEVVMKEIELSAMSEDVAGMELAIHSMTEAANNVTQEYALTARDRT